MFSDGEKKRRVEAVRGLMQDEKLDVLLTIGNGCVGTNAFVCSLAATTGINPDVILIISNICSGYAFWTVAASTNAAFILGRPEITPKFVWTKGVQTTVLFMVICYICGMAFTYIL